MLGTGKLARDQSSLNSPSKRVDAIAVSVRTDPRFRNHLTAAASAELAVRPQSPLYEVKTILINTHQLPI